MGGDCLNYGCVPSKALIAAGERAADTIRRAGALRRRRRRTPNRLRPRVHDHVHGVIAAIAPNDFARALRRSRRQSHPRRGALHRQTTVRPADATIQARRFVLATGSRAAPPPIPGLDDVPFFTNETIFEPSSPEHLIVIGGGPIGVELAQAHRRLGADVTVLQKAQPPAQGRSRPRRRGPRPPDGRRRRSPRGRRDRQRRAPRQRHRRRALGRHPDRRVGPAGRRRPQANVDGLGP